MLEKSLTTALQQGIWQLAKKEAGERNAVFTPCTDKRIRYHVATAGFKLKRDAQFFNSYEEVFYNENI